MGTSYAPQHKAIANSYREAILSAKRQGIDFADAPDDVQESLLALHQNALLVWQYETAVAFTTQTPKRAEGED